MKLFVVLALIAVAAAESGPKVTDKVRKSNFCNFTLNPNFLDFLVPQVWFDITIGGESAGRIEIGLFGGTVPKTVRNFKELAQKPVGEG